MPLDANAIPQIVHPMTALALWALLMTVLSGLANVFASARGADRDYYRVMEGTPPPEWSRRPARNVVNLFESPVLFYVLGVLTIITPGATVSMNLAWAFVGLRVLHSIVHLAINNVPLRALIWLPSVIVLIIMWINYASFIHGAS